ncbi:MAG: 2Fe-2S iron-sulfur cluster-binding protein [Planctomycetales bacterium]|nr:2Fe-2S iron-sulfur cluster-binding protein [Planctomycetales bacterium]
MTEFTLDGSKRTVPDGLSVLEAARTCGTEIPHFCYHPGLGPDGNCRLCLVEIEGARGLQTSCNTKLAPGMVVRAMGKDAVAARQAVLEFVLLNHPIDCPICDQAGECKLQDYYVALGAADSRMAFPKVRKRKREAIGAGVMLDKERCVLCARCTRFFSNVMKDEQLVIANRGNHAEIATFPGRKLDSPYAGNIVDICPVGALTSEAFRFRARVWLLQATPTICTGCATGCNIYADAKDGVVYRFRPRTNPDVNGWWICDEGRYSYPAVNENRLVAARIGRGPGAREASVEEAVAAAAAELAAVRDTGGTIAVVASPDASCEEVFLARRIAEDALRTPHRTGRSVKPPGVGDALLRHRVKHPNTPGVALVGLAPGAGGRDLPGLLSPPRPDAWLLLGGDLAAEGGAPAAEALSAARSVVAIVPHAGATAASATVALPGATWIEKDGTFVSAKGRLQRARAAFPPRGDARADLEILAALGAALGVRLPGPRAEETFRAMRAGIPALAGIEWDAIGEGGVALPGGVGPP